MNRSTPHHAAAPRPGEPRVRVRRSLRWIAVALLDRDPGLDDGRQRVRRAQAAEPSPHDPTRELYADLNQAFAKHWKEKTGEDVTIEQSHGGSGSQARAVIDGLPPTSRRSRSHDVDEIAKRSGRVPRTGRRSCPTTARPHVYHRLPGPQGNPKGIRTPGRPLPAGVEVITPNPKTSGGARWNFLAAWAYVLKQKLGSVAALKNPDPGGGGRGEAGGDSALQERSGPRLWGAWLDEHVRPARPRRRAARLGERGVPAVNEIGADQVEIVTPSLSVLAEPTVAVVGSNASKHGALEAAKEYLQYLYTPTGQAIVAALLSPAQAPRDADPKDVARFTKLELVTVDDASAAGKSRRRNSSLTAGRRSDLRPGRAMRSLRGDLRDDLEADRPADATSDRARPASSPRSWTVSATPCGISTMGP